MAWTSLTLRDWNRIVLRRFSLAWQKLTRMGRNARVPQKMLGYVRDYANDPGADVVVRVRAGELAKSNTLAGYFLRDLRSRKAHQVNLARAGRAVEVPPAPKPGVRGIEAPYPDALVIPGASLREGEYELRVTNAARQHSRLQYFVVRDPVTPADVGIIHPIFTWQAYNRENGGSLYAGWDHFWSKKPRVSLNRPLNMGSGHHTIRSILPFIRIAERMKLGVKSLSSLDVHERPDILAKCKVLLIAGHDEYWTHRMRDNIAEFIRNGGCVAVFSGNLGWWAVKLNGREIYVDKSDRRPKGSPPFSGQFRAPWVGKPQQELFGLAHQFAGYPAKRLPFREASRLLSREQYDSSGDITILDPSHPAFEGLGFSKGARWGGPQHAIGVELDGVFIGAGGQVDHIRSAQVPDTTKVLAKSLAWIVHPRPMPDGKTTAGLHFEEVGIAAECQPFPGGGVTIQFGSIGWHRALAHPDGVAAQITRNVITYLLKRHGEIARAR